MLHKPCNVTMIWGVTNMFVNQSYQPDSLTINWICPSVCPSVCPFRIYSVVLAAKLSWFTVTGMCTWESGWKPHLQGASILKQKFPLRVYTHVMHVMYIAKIYVYFSWFQLSFSCIYHDTTFDFFIFHFILQKTTQHNVKPSVMVKVGKEWKMLIQPIQFYVSCTKKLLWLRIGKAFAHN